MHNEMSLPYSADHYQVYSEMYQNMVRSQTFELTINNMTMVMDQDYQLLSRSDQRIQQSGLEQLVR
ncbi:hypothetical protein M3201_07315 [Paenibacillus motobuensis]|uniref:hypothetical protein n=1 Tax=Paenibacillus TaxID=44249 RepID=UPI00203BDDAA|nr:MULTISPECIES: hypothetical protein [Paenibacillus]MCM3039507.1 hypothetical protein [Paenibacillus lutimineralis]MCM3646611.1 hypothetical protein [Paenibacillus motobuensis]